MPELQRDRVSVVLNFLAETVDQPREPSLLIRMVRFWRSTIQVERCFGTGSPTMMYRSQPRHSAGLWRRLTSAPEYIHQHGVIDATNQEGVVYRVDVGFEAIGRSWTRFMSHLKAYRELLPSPSTGCCEQAGQLGDLFNNVRCRLVHWNSLLSSLMCGCAVFLYSSS